MRSTFAGIILNQPALNNIKKQKQVKATSSSIHIKYYVINFQEY